MSTAAQTRTDGHYWVRWNGKPWTVARYRNGVWLYPGWSLEVTNDEYFDEIDERPIQRQP